MDKENKFNEQPQDEILNDDVQETKEDISENNIEVEEKSDNKDKKE